MGAVVSGVIGAVVGFFIGGPVGAVYGFAAGYAMYEADVPIVTDVADSIADVFTPDIPDYPSYSFDDSPTYGNDRIGNTISEGVAVARCYGQCKIGGNKIKYNAADDSDLRIIVAHCMGPVNGIQSWKINDIDWDSLDGAHTKTEYTGTRAQAPDGRFTSRASAYRSIAYTAFTFVKDDRQVGYDPNVTVVMQGLKCAPLAGGADAFTRNPAVALYDWLLNVEGYTAGQLDNNAFQSLEEFCDAVPAGGTIARYRFDFNFDTNMAINDAKQLIWKSFNGKTIMSQGKVKPVWDAAHMANGSGSLTAKTVSHAFTEDNIVAGSLTWRQPERPNLVRIHLRDSAKNYKQSSVEVKDEKDISDHGEVLHDDQAWFITDAEVARRRAKYKFNKFKYTNYIAKLSAFSGAGDIEVYDLVTITHTLPGWTSKQFIITDRREDHHGRMMFTAEAYHAGVYDDSQAGTQANYESALPNPWVAVAVTSTALAEGGFIAGDGSYVPYVTLTFTKPNNPFWLRGQVWVSTDDSTFVHYGNTVTGAGFRIEAGAANFEEGDTLYVKVLSENNGGVAQPIADVSSISESIEGKTALPSNVAGFSVSQLGDVVIFSMNRPLGGTDADFSHFEIRQGVSWDSSLFIVTCTQTKYPLTSFTSGVKLYLIKAVDTSGNKSTQAATVRISLKAPTIQNVYYSEEEIVNIGNGTVSHVSRVYKSSEITYSIYEKNNINRIGGGTVSQIARKYVFDYAGGFFIDGTEKMDDSGVDTMDDSATERMWTPGYDSGYIETEAVDVGIITGVIYLNIVSSNYDGATHSVQYKISTDGITYTDYASFVDGVSATFRHIIFKITLTTNRSSYPESNIKITELLVNASIADVVGMGFSIDGTEKMNDSIADTMDDSLIERMWTPGYDSGYLVTEVIDVGAAVTGAIMLDVLSTGYLGTEYLIEYKTSIDGTNYTGYSDFAFGSSGTFRYLKFKITLMVDRLNYPQSNIKITGLLLSIDLPTIKNSGVDATIAAGGSTITFDTAYISAASIRIKINVVSASALIPTHELKTVTNFKAHVFNLAAEDVGGTIDWESSGF